MSVFTKSTDHSSGSKIAASDLWVFLLRFFIGYPMIHYQAWRHAKLGWAYMWEKKDWSVFDQMTAHGYSSPGPMAVTLVFFLLISSFGILIGFLTRLNAIILLICLGIVLIAPIELNQGSLTPQTLLIYIGLCLTLIISGSGFFSLDMLMTRRRRRKKKAPSRFA